VFCLLRLTGLAIAEAQTGGGIRAPGQEEGRLLKGLDGILCECMQSGRSIRLGVITPILPQFRLCSFHLAIIKELPAILQRICRLGR
jgi:hypothetical protein